MSAPESLFDVERFRGEPNRLALVRAPGRPSLVLGSTQPADVVRRDALRAQGIALARRRGGGGAVYVEPGDPLWLDAWVPRDDPLWRADVAAAAEWVGAWWVEALVGAGFGRADLEVHAGRALPGDHGALICFAGRGPGEVFLAGQKVVGLSQWRAREGSLFSSCAYLRWDPEPLIGLLELAASTRGQLAVDLLSVAVGLSELEPPVQDLGRVVDRLLASFASFGLSAG